MATLRRGFRRLSETRGLLYVKGPAGRPEGEKGWGPQVQGLCQDRGVQELGVGCTVEAGPSGLFEEGRWPEGKWEGEKSRLISERFGRSR